jgi:pimeloyl-ACP methyl ester carboxylesterase
VRHARNRERRADAVVTEFRFVRTSDGVDLCLRDLGGEGDTLLLGHPMGFHGAVMQPLAERLRGFHSYAFDLRGQGRSAFDDPRPLAAIDFQADALACVEALDPERTGMLGVGHSAGGTAMLYAELARPGTFTRLFIYEAALLPARALPPSGGDNPFIESVRRRRSSFASVEEAIANYAAKPPMARFTPEALSLYVDEGFAPQPDGSIELRCRPDREAEGYLAGLPQAVFERLGEIECEVLVAVGTSPDKTARGGYDAEVAETLPRGTLLRVPELDHFGPQSAPDQLAPYVQEFLDARR